MATMQQIAVLAGVSTATVSHVLNETKNVSPKLRERVLRVVRELNYQPSAIPRSLITRRTKTVGMLVTDITNPFYPVLVRGAEDVVSREGYALVVGNSDSDLRKEEAFYRAVMAKWVDGLILITCPTAYPPAYLSRHDLEQTPVVFVNRDYPSIRADAVLADNSQGSYEAVSHLLKSGHRKVGIITGPREHVMSVQRLSGYERALRDFGLRVDPDLVREGRFDIESGYKEVKALLALPNQPTALFVCNVPMTTGALQAIFESGRKFPGDIALVSFDDQDWLSAIRPTISAVAQPVYELGATAADILLKRITGALTAPPCRKILKTQLMLRESSNWLNPTT
jgi:LacI family transcriptional regulator